MFYSLDPLNFHFFGFGFLERRPSKMTHIRKSNPRSSRDDAHLKLIRIIEQNIIFLARQNKIHRKWNLN